jgi:Ca2+-binding EF-hand superfamily protein
VRPAIPTAGRTVLFALLLLAPLTAQGPAARRKRPAGDRAHESKVEPPTVASRADRYFAICDYDSDGRITFNEAQASLGLDREGFAAYDEDRDGWIIASEFRRRFAAIVETGGVFSPPKAKVVPHAARPATAEKVLEAFDKDRDGALDATELNVALIEMGASRMEPETALEQLDRDGSNKLESAEIEDLLALIQPRSSAARGPRPKSIDALFATQVPREIQNASTTQPARIVGPVSSFRRLDIDGDGRITPEDLAELQRPLVLPVRAAAVLAALDTDSDGVISETEFRASMRSAR